MEMHLKTVKHLNKLQEIAAGFILRKYANFDDIIPLKLLLIKDCINFNVLKLVFKGLL